MFNSVNNPFGQRIESAISTGQEKRQNQQNQPENKEKNILKMTTKTKLKSAVCQSCQKKKFL